MAHTDRNPYRQEPGEKFQVMENEEIIYEVIELIDNELLPEKRAISDLSEVDLSWELHEPGKDQLVNSVVQKKRSACTLIGEEHVVMNCDIDTVMLRQAFRDVHEMRPSQQLHDFDEGELVTSSIKHAVVVSRDPVKTVDNRVTATPLETQTLCNDSDQRPSPFSHEEGQRVLITSSVLNGFEESDQESLKFSSMAYKEMHEESEDRSFTISDQCYSSDEENSSDLHGSNNLKVAGRRIVDFDYILEQLREKFSKHGSTGCTISSLKLEKSVDRGLRALFYLRCQNCDYVKSIWSDRDDDKVMGINESAVCGTITAGTGCSTLQEMLAAMGIPCMSHVTYRKYRDRLYPGFSAAVDEETKRAGADERNRAIAKGHFVTINERVYATISVIADGCWAKRSYQGGKHDSLSGAATIIGAETGKALFVAVRNKYCSIHAKAEQLKREPPAHVCYKNWGRDQSSTAMETDILVEGFRHSVEMHGLIYSTLIADGDSSTFQSITDTHPYRDYGITVKKSECNNHLFRNLCRKIKDASKSRLLRPPEKGTMNVTTLREYVLRSGLRMRTVIEQVRDLRKSEDIPKTEKLAKFENDIFVIFDHIYGRHSACSTLPIPCQPEPDEMDVIPQLHRIGIYVALEEAVRYLSCHAESLLEKVTNNVAEGANSIINKFNYGKRINHCAKNSYEMRVYGATVQHNTQEVLSKVHLGMGKRVPASVYKMEKDRQVQIATNKLCRREDGMRKRRGWHGTDKDYGPSARKPDMPLHLYNIFVEKHLEKLKTYQKNRAKIERETVTQSESDVWHLIRADIITASKFGPVCRMLDSTSCSNMVASIRYPKVIDTAAVRFGITNEKKGLEALELILGEKIVPCGLFIHPEIPYLGATPDGLIDTDGIVEIKCPHSAKDMCPETAIEQIPHLRNIFSKKDKDCMNKNHPYYYQVIGQLEVTQRSYCIFAVWTSVGVKFVKVNRDYDFWSCRMEPLLSRFYMKCMLPEIVDSRRNRNMPIRDPEYILQAKNDLKRKREQKSTSIQDKERKKKIKIRDSILFDVPAQNASRVTGTNPNENIHLATTWIPITIDNNTRPSQQGIAILEGLRRDIRTDEVIADVLMPKSLLNDTSIDLFQNIVEANSDFRFHPTSYFAYYTYIEPCTAGQCMQIIGGNQNRHWCCVYYDGSKVSIYDSLCRCEYTLISAEEKRYIHKRYPRITPADILMQPVTKQPDQYSCGVYAAAFATAIALGRDPCYEKYSLDASKMRAHLARIVEQQQLLPFPIE